MDGLRKPSQQPKREVLQREVPLDPLPTPEKEPLDQRTIPRVRRSFFRILSFLLIIATLLFLTTLGFLASKAVGVNQKVHFESTNTSVLSQIKDFANTLLPVQRTPLLGEENNRINILLLGRAGEHYPGKNLTDTIMVASINTETKKVALLSLPRDLYVKIPETNLYTKINALYQFGESNNTGVTPIKKAVEEVTGQPLHYFFIIDFDGFEKTIDTLGGIRVDVVRDFFDPTYPGKNYSYETFEIKKGWQTLDGATTLKYVRERHNDPEGDFGRAKRQQQVIQSVKDKAFSVGTFLNPFVISGLLDTLGESVRTDVSLENIQSLVELLKVLDTKNINTFVVDAWKKESLLRVSHVLSGSTQAFILVPRTGNWNEIRDISQNIFSLDILAKRREEIKKENATLTIVSRPADRRSAQKIATLAQEEFGITETTIVSLETFENSQRESMIIDRSSLSKPFALDELLKKLPLKRTENFQTILPEGNQSDFVLFLGKDLAEELSFEESNIDQNALDDNLSSEPLPPQPKR
ncbi:MAG: LCP family protein [Patescibacteria group bacterium]